MNSLTKSVKRLNKIFKKGIILVTAAGDFDARKQPDLRIEIKSRKDVFARK